MVTFSTSQCKARNYQVREAGSVQVWFRVPVAFSFLNVLRYHRLCALAKVDRPIRRRRNHFFFPRKNKLLRVVINVTFILVVSQKKVNKKTKYLITEKRSFSWKVRIRDCSIALYFFCVNFPPFFRVYAQNLIVSVFLRKFKFPTVTPFRFFCVFPAVGKSRGS